MIKAVWLLFLIPMIMDCRGQSFDLRKDVDEAARSYMDKKNVTGFSIGVLQGGSTQSFYYGEVEKGSGKKPDAETIFEIGSITKTFTATLLALAVGEGRVKLDDPVNKFLPDSIPSLQYEGRVIMLKDLINHTSGIPRLPSNFWPTVVNSRDPYIHYSIDDLYSFLRHLALTRKPGEKFDYSNVGVGLVGVILQKIYDKPYEELVVHYICEPLGMSHTRVTLRAEDSLHFAKGYDENGNYNGPWNFTAAITGAGSIRSTVADMLKYAAVQIDPSRAPGALGDAIRLTHEVTFNGGRMSLGLSWIILHNENDILFHNGGTGGFRAYLGISIGKELAVVILSNTTASPDDVGNALMKKERLH